MAAILKSHFSMGVFFSCIFPSSFLHTAFSSSPKSSITFRKRPRGFKWYFQDMNAEKSYLKYFRKSLICRLRHDLSLKAVSSFSAGNFKQKIFPSLFTGQSLVQIKISFFSMLLACKSFLWLLILFWLLLQLLFLSFLLLLKLLLWLLLLRFSLLYCFTIISIFFELWLSLLVIFSIVIFTNFPILIFLPIFSLFPFLFPN